METIEEWDNYYKTATAVPVCDVLKENLHLLSNQGQALDLACGLAKNGILLAERGYQVDAWDNSIVAVEKVNQFAKSNNLTLRASQLDIIKVTYPKSYYDVIVFTHFLEQSLTQSVIDALRPNGLLFFQTFTRQKVKQVGPTNDIYCLADNELHSMFSPLKVLVYREEEKIGDTSLGFRNEAMLVAIKK